jgi:hypothetical protein
MEHLAIYEVPSLVQIGKTEFREVYGERLYIAYATLGWPNTNEVRAQIAIWKHVVAARLIDEVRGLNDDETYNVGLGGNDFLDIESTKKIWKPILDALKQAGYRAARSKSRKTGSPTRISKKRFNNLRLKPELVPLPLWGRSVCSVLGRHSSRWRKIRKQVLEAASGTCEICGTHQEKGMICHEQWHYDDAQHIATLIGFEIVCSDCNLVLHSGWSSILVFGTALNDPAKALELWIRRETHIERVNGIAAEEKLAVQKYSGALHSERSKHEWSIRISAEVIQRFPFLNGIGL